MTRLTFDEIAAELRSRTEAEEITAWNHRVNVMTAEDVWIIDFLPGNEPRVVEWSSERVQEWIIDRDAADALLRTL